MEEAKPLLNQIGKKLTSVKSIGYDSGEGVEFPEALILTFEDKSKIEISYVVYPEGSSWLRVEENG